MRWCGCSTGSGRETSSTRRWAFLRTCRDQRMLEPIGHLDYLAFTDTDRLREDYTEGLRVLTLGLTERCNQRCSYCACGGAERARPRFGNMSWDTAKTGIDYLLARANGQSPVTLDLLAASRSCSGTSWPVDPVRPRGTATAGRRRSSSIPTPRSSTPPGWSGSSPTTWRCRSAWTVPRTCTTRSASWVTVERALTPASSAPWIGFTGAMGLLPQERQAALHVQPGQRFARRLALLQSAEISEDGGHVRLSHRWTQAIRRRPRASRYPARRARRAVSAGTARAPPVSSRLLCRHLARNIRSRGEA